MVLFNEYSKNYVKNEFIEQKCINEDNSFCTSQEKVDTL